MRSRRQLKRRKVLRDYKDAHRIVGFHQGGERPKGEFYATCPRATIELLEKEKFGQTVLEPCCGNGAISKILQDNGYTVISRDLYDWGYGETGKDFLVEPIVE